MRSGYAQPLEEMTEKDWQKQVVELAQTLGWRKAYHTYDSRRSHSGFPDLVLVRERVVFAELKREKTKLSPSQCGWMRALLDAGAEAYVLRPRHLDQLARVLAHRGDPFQARGDLPDIAARLRQELREEALS